LLGNFLLISTKEILNSGMISKPQKPRGPFWSLNPWMAQPRYVYNSTWKQILTKKNSDKGESSDEEESFDKKEFDISGHHNLAYPDRNPYLKNI